MSLYVYMFICLYTCIYNRLCTYMCVCVCVCVFIGVCGTDDATLARSPLGFASGLSTHGLMQLKGSAFLWRRRSAHRKTLEVDPGTVIVRS